MNDLRDRIRLEDAIKNIFRKNNLEFFSYAWRENVDNFLTAESKFSQLVDWINERLKDEFTMINVNNPADKDETYSVSKMKSYLEACRNVSLLVNAKEILIDDKCTTKMRENLEYTLCKIFNLKYNKDLGYIPKG